MKLQGSYEINKDKNSVWEALNNPDVLQKCIPGCEKFIKNSKTSFSATATNQIGPFNATFSGSIDLTDLDPPNSYKIIGQGQSPVGFASGEAEVNLIENNGITTLTYLVEANVGGKIAQIGSRLIDMTAKKMADIFFENFIKETFSKETIKSEKKEKESGKFFEIIKTNKKLLYIVVFISVVLFIYLVK